MWRRAWSRRSEPVRDGRGTPAVPLRYGPGTILWAISARRLHTLRTAALPGARIGLAFAPGGLRLRF